MVRRPPLQNVFFAVLWSWQIIQHVLVDKQHRQNIVVLCFAPVGGGRLSSLHRIQQQSSSSSSSSPPTRQQQQQEQQKATKRFNSAVASGTEESSNDDENALATTKKKTKPTTTFRIWPCLDGLDKRLIQISLPMIAVYAVSPIIGAVDLFWVNQMRNPLAVAGQAAANQLFNSIYWITTFLPSVAATLISKENAQQNAQGVQDAICQAMLVAILLSLTVTILILTNPGRVLSSVLSADAPALQFARPYLLIRTFTFLPSLLSLVAFSAFRGLLDSSTPLKVCLFANVCNAILDPILMFGFNMGVTGAAIATLVSEVLMTITYMALLTKKKLISWQKIFCWPSWSRLRPLLRGSAALQLRNLAMNVAFLAIARVTQAIDATGVAASAHALAIQVFQLGSIVLFALSTVSQTVVPNDLVQRYDAVQKRTIGGPRYAQHTVHRLMAWSLLLGTALGAIQLLLLPWIQKTTPMQEVRQAARIPSYIASFSQVINGAVFIGEGIMIGTGSFFHLSIGAVLATVGCVGALQVLPCRYGITGVWIGLLFWNLIRLASVVIHQCYNGPLAERVLRKQERQQTETSSSTNKAIQ
jgi:multidrug resistance protein, MATE family